LALGRRPRCNDYLAKKPILSTEEYPTWKLKARRMFYLEWVKGRLDEIDTTLASLEGCAAKLYGDARAKADRAVADMHQARDTFGKLMKEQAKAGQETLAQSKEALKNQWALFERSFQTYVDAAGKQVDVQRAAFEARAAGQRMAWQEAIDELHKSATA